jgi:hypothetical protein
MTAAPTIDPLARTAVPDAQSYHRDQPVWVWVRDYDTWLPGVVEGTSWFSVQVWYELPAAGSKVDTVVAEYVMPRVEADE